jgi:hypothetical protein
MLRNGLLVTALATLLALGMLTGCSDDGGPKPVRSVSLAVDSTGVEICATLEITAQVNGGETKSLDWYVNGVLGGTSEIGTISQANPSVYTAPDSIPAEATVTIKAISGESPTKMDSCRVTIQFTVLHVNAATGNDDTGSGCITAPFKTITHALAEADSGFTVLAAPGVYDVANGEVFPLTLNSNISLAGEDWMTTVIRGHNPAAGYGGAMYMYGHQPAVRRLTLEMGEPADPRWSVAIYVVSSAVGVVIDSVRTSDWANYSFIRIDGADSTTVSNCNFVIPGEAYSGRGFEIVFDDDNTIIRDCTVSGFHTGLFFNYPSEARVEGCIIEGNRVGVEICCLNDPNSDPTPDLGGGARGSLGNNSIRNNLNHGLYHEGTQTIYAKYNAWNTVPPTVGPTAGTDIYIQGTGSVLWE